MSYQAGTYEVCCDCGVLIPLHRLKEHPVICNQVNDETYPDFLDAVYELSTPDLIDLLNDWVASTRLERLTFEETEPKISAITYELELRAQGGLD